jgi:hypothetical protein
MVTKTATRITAAVFLAAAALKPITVNAQTGRFVLEVDRFTGAATLRNPSANTLAIDLISYTLNSPSNVLDTSNARWKSFQDAGKPGWFEANATTINLSELASAAPLSMAPNASHDFGTPFTANTNVPLRTDPVAIGAATFKYQAVDGSLVNADIELVGRFNDLVLVVNPNTGFATLQNQSAQPIEFVSYTVSSTSGSLLPSYTGSGLPNWFKANPTANNLAELSSGNSIVLNEGGEVDLGIAWSTAGQQDLTFVYQEPNDGNLLTGTVHFGAKALISGPPGDYNGDGKVNAADYVVWRKNPTAHGGNPAGYNTWRANFGRTSGGAASAAGLNAVTAPEPSAIAIAVLAVLASRLFSLPQCKAA